jgi:phosphatidylinositol-3-phosphatase
MSALQERWLDVEQRIVALAERLVPKQKAHGGRDRIRGETHDRAEQTPSPWAIAVAVLALLGFGVLVGTTVSPAQEGPSTLVLPSSSVRQAAGTQTNTAPPPIEPEVTPSGAGSQAEAGGEGGEQSSTEAGAEAAAKSNGSSAKKSKGTKKPGGSGGGGKGKSGPSGGGESEHAAGSGPSIKHVFLIVLSEEGYAATFGAGAAAPYLSRTLPSEGELLPSYYAVAGGEPANAIALISGQGPTPQTLQNCPLYSDIAPAGMGPEGQTLGNGCVYPKTTLTIADELESAGKTWRAYIEGLEEGGPSPAGGSASSSGPGSASVAAPAGGCPHPPPGASDPDLAPSSTSGYAGSRNPFVYFHSLIDGPACAKNDVGVGRLATDLARTSTTPSFAYIAPDACDDGSQTPCRPGAPAGIAPAETFLRRVVPEIEKSAAYKDGGLIAITFDQAPQSGPGADSSGCCVSGPYPNLPAGSPAAATPGESPSSSTAATGAPSTQTGTPAGGGKVGLLLISKYVKPGSLNMLGEYDHFSLLLTIERLFGCEPLGYSGAKGLLSFDSSVFNGRH